MWCILIVLAGLIAYGTRAAEEPLRGIVAYQVLVA
jgi:hypothetical protein